MGDKVKIATCSLSGCFGCHMSFLDIDERILALAEVVSFDRSPITDIKHCGTCDIGLVEGGLCNLENIEVLQEFRENCKILVAVGACAINGGIPAMRNHFSAQECLAHVYLDALGVEQAQVPCDPELPPLLKQVKPIHQAVDIDYFLPGCPPSADAFWQFLTTLISGETPELAYQLRRAD